MVKEQRLNGAMGTQPAGSAKTGIRTRSALKARPAAIFPETV